LKIRIAPLCKRTLRKQVLEYVQFTERRYLRRPVLAALPESQRQLITLVLHMKMLLHEALEKEEAKAPDRRPLRTAS
jgi:hypothetical protein